MINVSFFKRLLQRNPQAARTDEPDEGARGDHSAAALRERAEGGEAAAQLSLARRLERGDGVPQDYVAAERWLRLAAEQGSVPAQARLGEIYLTGMPAPGSEMPAVLSRLDAGVSVESLFQRLFPDALVIAQDPQQAAHWHARAAQGGDAASQARLGHAYASGFGVERDFALAEHWFAAAAAQQNLAGALGLGLLYAGGYGGPAEHARALEWLERCMDRDNASAQMCLAILLLYGEGVTHDEVRALALLEHAAAAGQPAAMFHLGELYRRGRGVARSASQAETWLRRAALRGYLPARLSLVQLLRASPDADAKAIAAMCREAAELGDGEAQYLLGQMCLAGEGVARDTAEAARWFSKAADQNVTAASERIGAHGALGAQGALGWQGLALRQELHGAADWFYRAEVYGDNQGLYHLGTLQLGGLALPRDPQAACSWTQLAAERGSDAACLALGMLYAAGQLVEQNYTQAARWYGAAAQHGDALARCYLALLHLRGLGVTHDAAQALSMLASAAEAGCIEAAWALHDQYSSGEQVARDAQAAMRWLVRAAELGSSAAVCRLAQRLEHGDLATVTTLAAERVIDMLKGCATAGHAEAQAMLGLWYLRGKQLQEDQPLALAWITRAAQGGHALAQAVLGDMLVLGLGVAVDADAAALWYERAALQGHAGAITALTSLRMAGGKGVGGSGAGGGSDHKSQMFQLWLRAAEQGHAGAQRMVGQFYLRGIGTTISQPEGRRWLAAASRQGDAAAMVLLGGQLLGGLVLQPTQAVTDPSRADDQALAAELFRRAAARGNIDAYYNLGECLRLGIGVPRDDAKAERLYAAAAQHGHVLAQQALGGLKARSAGAVTEPRAAAEGAAHGTESVPERGEMAFESG